MGSRSFDVRRMRERLSGTPRLVLAVLLLAAGTLVALTATAPAVAGPVVIAVHRIGAGAVLTAGDLAVARRAVADRPDGALLDPDPAVGHRVVASLARGEVLTSTRLAPHGFAADLASGRAIATAAVSVAGAGVVTVGDVVRLVVASGSTGAVDVVGSGATDSEAAPLTLSDDARVLAVWSATDGDDTATLVVDVDVGSASRLAVIPTGLLVGVVLVTA